MLCCFKSFLSQSHSKRHCLRLFLCFQIFRIEEELKVRFNAEEIWTGLKTGPEKLETLLSQESWSKTELTSNPLRVQWLLSKLKELRNRMRDLEKNTAFRPPISQVWHCYNVLSLIFYYFYQSIQVSYFAHTLKAIVLVGFQLHLMPFNANGSKLNNQMHEVNWCFCWWLARLRL